MSAYNGYRLKINGVIVPNVIMSRGTWSASNKKRLVSSWTDANGVLHEYYYDKKQANISFTLREHTVEEHDSFITYFTDHTHVAVEYWDDDTAGYLTFDGKIEDIDWSHNIALENEIRYNPTEISILEY